MVLLLLQRQLAQKYGWLTLVRVCQVAFLHPVHNFALVTYDPAALGPVGAKAVAAATLLPGTPPWNPRNPKTLKTLKTLKILKTLKTVNKSDI